MRQFLRFHWTGDEDTDEFLGKCTHLVRLFLEEAFRRCLLSGAAVRKRALCGLMVAMRSFEADMIPMYQAELGIFYTFTEVNVRNMAVRISNPEVETTLEICPSFNNVMSTKMKIEVLSLMQVRPHSGAIHMTQAEVRSLIEFNNGDLHLYPNEVLPGRSEGPSMFEDLFADEENQVEGGAEATA